MLHFRLKLFKSAYQRVRRTQMQPRGQLIQLLGRTHRVGFHAAVIQVPDPAGHTNRLRVLFYE